MKLAIPGRGQRSQQQTDSYAVTVTRARCLAELITQPQNYTHRFIEQLSFKARGGQQWQRLIQIRIPEQGGTPQASWWIVPLGPFRRRRFPDISVVDATGRCLNFVTRAQHGVALTKAILSKHVFELDLKNKNKRLHEKPVRKQYVQLRNDLHAFYTKLGNDADRAAEVKCLVNEYSKLLAGLGLSSKAAKQQLADFSVDLAAAVKTTQYLCWVEAQPGEVVHLRVSHSTRDPKHKLESGTLLGLLQAWCMALFGWIFGKKSLASRREVWNRWYVQYGLAPIPYAFNIPTYDYTASYYSTLDPPNNTEVAYLDWEQNNNWNSHSEVDSSLDSLHIFRTDDAAGLVGKPAPYQNPITTRAYLRCTPSHHKILLGIALMSLVLVVLLAVGRFPSSPGNPMQTLVTASPSIVIALLAQQQRHYYSRALRRMRGILWTYLSFEVLFLIAVTFSSPVDGAGTAGISWKATTAAWILATSSVFVFFWQLPLGHSYERTVKFLTERKKRLAEQGAAADLSSWPRRLCRWAVGLRWDSSFTADWQCYEIAVEQYSRLIRRAIVGAVILTLILLGVFWKPALPREDKASAHVTISVSQNRPVETPKR
jgi:hypothetical protein